MKHISWGVGTSIWNQITFPTNLFLTFHARLFSGSTFLLFVGVGQQRCLKNKPEKGSSEFRQKNSDRDMNEIAWVRLPWDRFFVLCEQYGQVFCSSSMQWRVHWPRVQNKIVSMSNRVQNGSNECPQIPIWTFAQVLFRNHPMAFKPNSKN